MARCRRFDPEAEQEVDFGRYWRLIAARWWLARRRPRRRRGDRLQRLARRQPDVQGDGQPLSRPAVHRERQRAAPERADEPEHRARDRRTPSRAFGRVALACKVKASDFRSGISTQALAGNIAKNGQTAGGRRSPSSRPSAASPRARRTSSRSDRRREDVRLREPEDRELPQADLDRREAGRCIDQPGARARRPLGDRPARCSSSASRRRSRISSARASCCSRRRRSRRRRSSPARRRRRSPRAVAGTPSSSPR